MSSQQLGVHVLNNLVADTLDNIGNRYTAYKKSYISGRNAAFCPRLNYFNSQLENPVSIPARNKLAMEFGKTHETLFLKSLDNLSDMWYDLTINDELFPIDNLSYFGVIDTVIKQDNKYYLADIKSKHELGEDHKPYDTDIAQVSFYAAITGLDPYLIYLSRKVQEKYGEYTYTVLPIAYDRKHILHMAFFSSYCIKHNILPKVPKNFKRSVQCKYCDFYDKCWKTHHPEPLYAENFGSSFNQLTMDAYTITEQYAEEYITHSEEYTNLFLNKMMNNQLQGKYYKSLDSRID
jgi:CRISPR/Cas system-associated exonuclease Cas4 (RecB family)